MSKESELPTDAANADDRQSTAGDPTRPARRQVLKGAATLATAIALGGEASAQDLNNATTPAGNRKVTLTLQQMDISVQPVGKQFDVTLLVRKDAFGTVDIEIPTIEQVFSSSKDSPHFAPADFPTLIPKPPAGEKASAHSYPKLPDNYPLGGFIDTVDNPHTSGVSSRQWPSHQIYRRQQITPRSAISRFNRPPRSTPVFRFGRLPA